MKEEAPNYLITLIPKCEQTIRTRNNNIPVYHYCTESFKHCLFPSTLKDWFSLDDSIRNSETISTFKNRLLLFIRLVQNNIFNIFDLIRLKFLTRLRLGFIHLNELKFRHNFQDCMNNNTLCSCSLEIEDTLHYLLHCHHFDYIPTDPMSSVKSVYDNFESLFDKDIKDILLYGDSRLDRIKNKFILEAT